MGVTGSILHKFLLCKAIRLMRHGKLFGRPNNGEQFVRPAVEKKQSLLIEM
jgi:hypothetical protein